MNNTGSWLIAWVVIIVAGIGLNSFEGGRKVLYYLLWLLVLLMLVAYSEEIQQIFVNAGIVSAPKTGAGNNVGTGT